MSEDEMGRNVNAFNKLFGFRTEVREGTLGILNKTWNKAKESLR